VVAAWSPRGRRVVAAWSPPVFGRNHWILAEIKKIVESVGKMTHGSISARVL
jgi:hypothetical protein